VSVPELLSRLLQLHHLSGGRSQVNDPVECLQKELTAQAIHLEMFSWCQSLRFRSVRVTMLRVLPRDFRRRPWNSCIADFWTRGDRSPMAVCSLGPIKCSWPLEHHNLIDVSCPYTMSTVKSSNTTS
jgi:hypothetical protein